VPAVRAGGGARGEPPRSRRAGARGGSAPRGRRAPGVARYGRRCCRRCMCRRASPGRDDGRAG